VEIYQLDVFTTIAGEGNPAGVVLKADRLDEKLLGEIARQTMLETAFGLQPFAKEAQLRLRYFAPNGQEMNLCSHATLAALYLLGSLGQLTGDCVIETQAGLLQASVQIENGQVSRVLCQQPNPTFNNGPFPLQEVAKALGLSLAQLQSPGLPLVAASTGRAKLLVPLADYATLDSIELDRPALNALCQRFGLTGLYPFTLQPRNQGIQAEARQFPYNLGFEEDPVTGLAMGALGAYLLQYSIVPAQEGQNYFVMEQGHAIGCPGRAEVFICVAGGTIREVRVGGMAVIIDKSTFDTGKFA